MGAGFLEDPRKWLKKFFPDEGRPGCLGKGAFGEVRKAEALGIVVGEISTIVAVKTIRTGAEIPNEQKKVFLSALVRELKIMSNIGRHLNIVNLLGYCTKKMKNGKVPVHKGVSNLATQL